MKTGLVFLAVSLLVLSLATEMVQSERPKSLIDTFQRNSNDLVCNLFSNTSCDNCTSHNNCVWCDNGTNKTTCVDGNFFGPSSARCDNYYSSSSCSLSGQDFWIIIGCSGGGLLIVILVFVYCCCCRNRRHHHEEYMPFVADSDGDYVAPSEASQRRDELKQKWNL